MSFTCEYCSINFTEERTLCRHIKSKHYPRNFRCDKCEFSTTRKDNLRAHIDSKHYGKKFKCSECSKEFNRNDKLARYQKTLYPKDPLAPIPMNWAEEVEREEKLLTPTPEPVVLPSPTPPPISMDDTTVQKKSAFDKQLV